MREVLYTCDYCGQNLGISEGETDRNMTRNVLVNGIGYIDVILHDGDHTPQKACLHVNLNGLDRTKINRDICEDCLMQGQKYLVIGMPERTEDEKV